MRQPIPTLALKVYHSQGNIDIKKWRVCNKGKSHKQLAFGVLVFIFITFCEVLWKNSFGIFIPQAGYFLYPSAFIGLVFYSINYIVRKRLHLSCTKGHWMRVRLYFVLLTGLLFFGLVRGNPPNFIFHEAILLYSLGLFLVLGVDDNVCNSLVSLLTAVFWLAFALSLITFDVAAFSAQLAPSEGVQGYDGRYTKSVAYVHFRPFLDLALPLFLCGWSRKRSNLFLPQIVSLLGYLVVNVMIFQFRGAFSLASLVIIAAFFMPSSTTRKIRLALFLLICGLVIFCWLQTEGGVMFIDRMYQFSKTGVVDYRLPETERYFKEVGYEWLWGRGLGGTFELGGLFKPAIFETQWSGVHIGWLTLTLKGGIAFLVIILSFLASLFRRGKINISYDPYRLVAQFWIPVMFVNWLVNPIGMHAINVPVYGLSFILLARFGKRDQ